MDNKCLICNQEFTERSHFWKNHKIKEADYYEKYYPRHDLLTNEIITFKSVESYQLTDFTDKRNLRKYLESLSTNGEVFGYLIASLFRRKELKDLQFAPSEFEIKSLMFPSIKYIEEKYGEKTYKFICKNAGLLVRYIYEANPESFYDDKDLVYICDTREQNILKLPNMQIAKLDFGDYTVEKSNVFIERKSLNDLVGTLSGGYERFHREIDRCVSNDKQLIVLIEEKYQNILSFNYLPHMRYSKCSPDFIFHRIRELLNKYPLNLQFLAVDGRKEAVRVLKKIFNLGYNINTLDLQFLYNKEKL